MVVPARDAPVPFLTLPAWLQAANHCGFALEPILEHAGIEVDLVHLESARIDQRRFARAMLACVRAADAVGRAHFPFALAHASTFDYLPELPALLRTSATLRDTVRVFEWVRALLNPRLQVRIEEEAALAWLRIEFAGDVSDEDPLERYFSEALLAAIHHVARVCFGTSSMFERIEFRHAAPSYAALYREYFSMDVSFGARRHGMAIARSVLDVPLEGAYPLLHRQNELRLTQRFGAVAPVSGVAARMQRAFAEDPTLLGRGIEEVAERLALHPRTLQRRLKKEQDNFIELQARTRMELASAWLREDNLPIATISERLGFADRRGFSRAFARWAGMTPNAFRERALLHEASPTDPSRRGRP